VGTNALYRIEAARPTPPGTRRRPPPFHALRTPGGAEDKGHARRPESRGALGTTRERTDMIKVRTFMTPIKIFATARELGELDAQVTDFLASENATEVYSVGDATTAGEHGETIGLIRTVCYGV
jgi:hypothetical protein